MNGHYHLRAMRVHEYVWGITARSRPMGSTSNQGVKNKGVLSQRLRGLVLRAH
jgi:hypothetical protein